MKIFWLNEDQLKTNLIDSPGYRSPLCLVPMDIIPDPSCCFGSGQTGHHKKQINNFKDQFVYTEQELGSSQSNNGHSVECSSKKSWWLEAVKVADDLESKPKELGFINMVSLLNKYLLPPLYLI